MELKSVRVEYRENPIGLDVKNPRFSWKLVSEKNDTLQTAYEIKVTNETGDCVWDTQKVESDSSILNEYKGTVLEAETVYQAEIKVWDNHGEEATETVSFETGLMNPAEMKAEWITHAFSEEEKACPVFFKEFATEKKIKRARIYATALGLYEISLDGERVGDAYFTPGWTSYHHRIQYQTYDVTEMVTEKKHRVEITLADGWYKGPFGFTLRPNIYGDKVAALAEIHLTYEDGTKEIIKTDDSWNVTTGSIRESQIYFGETIDANVTAKAQEAFPVCILDHGKDMLVAQENEPVRIVEKRAAKELIVTPKNEVVLDFGQNMSGFVEVHFTGTKGQKLVISHAEVLDRDGNFYPETLRQARSMDTFICNGEAEVFRPHFTFHGFRYIKVEGIPAEEMNLSNFYACTLHSDMEPTGTFSCSDERINQLQSNIRWGMKGNFLDIPTDCPQRDERLGWTGDAQVFASTASYLMNTALFYKKWLRDMKAEQTKEFGPPHVVPNILGNQAAGAAWSDAATVIPWVVYETFGDKQVLEEQFESMKGYVDYITEHCDENGLWQNGYQYGDWLALDKEESADRTGATDKYLVANAYYAYSCKIVADAAKVLGKEELAEEYGTLHEKIVELFNEEYITRTGRMVSETQTGCVLALHFKLAKEQYRERIMKSLIQNIEVHKNHLSTGFVGTPYICHALSENGQHDLAGTIFLQEDYPSWIYAVKKGATTIWERWNSIMPDGTFDESGMNSLNHYAYGSIGSWMYQKIAGINLLEPGYKKFYVRPIFTMGITHAKATYESVYGTIESAVSCENGKITVDVTVPANTTAEIYLPEKEGCISVGSGKYHYEYETATKLERLRFTMDSTLQQLLEEPLAVELFHQYVPGMLDGPMIQFAMQMTLAEMCAVAPEAKPLYEMVINTLNQQ